MATATLTFDMNEPDDVMDHLRATQALDLALIVWNIQYNTFKDLESIITRKMESPEFTHFDVLDVVRERINDLITEHGVNIDKLID